MAAKIQLTATNQYEESFHTGWGAVFEYKVLSIPAAGTTGLAYHAAAAAAAAAVHSNNAPAFR